MTGCARAVYQRFPVYGAFSGFPVFPVRWERKALPVKLVCMYKPTATARALASRVIGTKCDWIQIQAADHV